MSSVLLVPMHLDALVLAGDAEVVEASADFTRLPYSVGTQDVQSDTANISEDIVSSPFDDQGLYLKSGIHLHWALPDTLTAGEHTETGTTFPSVPNRWLIRRSGPNVAEKCWVVESDYLYPDGEGGLAGSVNIPFPPDPARNRYRPFRFQGRSMPLEAWQPQDPTADYLDDLTAIGYGQPAFAAFYPNCLSVFGFHDGDFGGAAPSPPTGLQYDVIGWYGTLTRDCLTQFVTAWNGAHPGGTWMDLTVAVSAGLDWDVPETQDFPGQMLCYARMTFGAEASGAPDPKVDIAIGATATEALSAYLAQKVASQSNDGASAADIEDQLEAVGLADQLQSHALDIGPKFAEARHQKGFTAVDSGSLWTIRPETTSTSTGADASVAGALAEVTLPDDLAHTLNELNLLQGQYDRAVDSVESMRVQLFADWYKYMLSAYPPPDSTDDYPDVDTVRYFIEQKGIAPLEEVVAALGELQLQFDTDGGFLSTTASPAPCLAAEVAECAGNLQAALGKLITPTVSYKLKQVPGPRYWQPREPVVLMVGTAIQPTDRHGTDGQLPCTIMPDTTVQELIPGGLASIWSAVDSIAESAGGETPAGIDTWTGQPWNPFLLEWEVEIFPLAGGSNLDPDTGAYDPAFVTVNYLLKENDPDLSLAQNGALTKGANVYSGRSILTRYASSRLKDQLDAFLSGITPEMVKASTPLQAALPHLQSAQAIVSDPTFQCLSQSLGGFNEALLMHRQTLQLPIADPLGFDDYQTFTQAVAACVGTSNRSAAQPLSDFNPIRSGAMLIHRLRLIDTFGQVLDLQPNSSIAAQGMTGAYGPGWISLPPRLVQPARLNFRWLSAESDDQEMNDHPATTPICGWLLPNNLDSSLMVYDGMGAPLGIVDMNAQWECIPGWAKTPVDHIPNLHLRRLIGYLLDQDSDFLQAFLSSVDTALENIDPESFAQHQDLALLMGRPVALVRASLNLEVQGLPAVHQGWNSFRADLQRTTRDADRFPLVQFPVRLGEFSQMNDGLVGYWKEAGGGYEGNIFYTPQSDHAGNPLISTVDSDTAPLRQTVEEAPLTVSMLVDPRGTVHATCGICPVKEISIPPDQYTPALGAIEIVFLSAPVLTRVGEIDLPLPAEPGYGWTWLPDNQQIGPITTQATFGAPPEIREGWLKLAPAPTPNTPST